MSAEGEKVEKEKVLPKDAQVMVAILKDMGINDFEPRVINQMLEFSYRYVTGILEDARVYSSHARKKTLDTEDVKLAVQLAAEQVIFKTLPLIKTAVPGFYLSPSKRGAP